MSAQSPSVSPPARSAYQTALVLASWCAVIGVTISCVAWLWPPHLTPLIALQRLDPYKQWTGYILVGLLSFDLSLALIKRQLVSGRSLRMLQIAHRVLGLTMLAMLVMHAGFAHQGFLNLAFLITMLVVLAGALLNLLPSRHLGSWGQWTTVLHIGAGCLLAALALMHLYFVYTYAS